MSRRKIDLDREKSLNAVRMEVKLGLEALERGDYDEVEEDQLEAYLNRLVDRNNG
ncbi:MAG: hypothetical protein JO134_07470 [Xanthobacteraceae bacterium]|nr:hypothetical protein [Xanthobacteraceae bacterium]